MTKKRIFQIFLLLGTLVSLCFVPWPLLKLRLTPLPTTVQAQVDEATKLGFAGIVVYVDQKGEAPVTYTAGWHDQARQIPARADALFKIASIGKLYDAVSVTKLVHAQQLSLDKTLTDYFPELSGRIEHAEHITVRMLVQHRSGIPNLTDTPNFWNDPPQTQEEALERALDLPANFAPDARYEYCNTNYLLLSMLVEKASGMPPVTYLRAEVLEPLGLQHTFASIQEVNMDELMSGYYVGIEEDIKTTDYGSMVATAEDVGIFLRALNDGSLFTEGEQDLYSSLYKFNHTGLIPGYQSIARYHPDQDAVVIQFTNTTDFEGYHWGLSEIVYQRILKILSKAR